MQKILGLTFIALMLWMGGVFAGPITVENDSVEKIVAEYKHAIKEAKKGHMPGDSLSEKLIELHYRAKEVAKVGELPNGGGLYAPPKGHTEDEQIFLQIYLGKYDAHSI